jgi:hypothetical protein
LVRQPALVDGRKCLLLAHAGTLFSVFVPDIRKAGLVPIGPSVVGIIHTELESEGLLDSRRVTLSKTESRVVLGYMNEMARFCEFAIDDVGGLARCDARELNRELRRELHLSRRSNSSTNLASRSCIAIWTGFSSSPSSQVRFLACWVTHAWWGWAVQLA